MKYIVIEEHISNYPEPITLKKGDKVIVGRRYERAEDWVNWRYCYQVDKSEEGWIPEQLMNIAKQYGVLKGDYTARELTIKKEERVVGSRELNGWIWCKDRKGREGWVPKNCLVKESENAR